MKAIMLGHDLIKAGSATVVVAGGMESMTNAPHMLQRRAPASATAMPKLVDHMAWDGLTNPYDGKAMGVFAEARARQVQVHARGAGCVRDRIGQARAGGDQRPARSRTKSCR